MIKVELPYDFGDFVKGKSPNGEHFFYGTVEAYNCVVKNGFFVCVSGYKEPISVEFKPSDVTLLTDEEIGQLIKERGE